MRRHGRRVIVHVFFLQSQILFHCLRQRLERNLRRSLQIRLLALLLIALLDFFQQQEFRVLFQGVHQFDNVLLVAAVLLRQRPIRLGGHRPPRAHEWHKTLEIELHPGVVGVLVALTGRDRVTVQTKRSLDSLDDVLGDKPLQLGERHMAVNRAHNVFVFIEPVGANHLVDRVHLQQDPLGQRSRDSGELVGMGNRRGESMGTRQRARMGRGIDGQHVPQWSSVAVQRCIFVAGGGQAQRGAALPTKLISRVIEPLRVSFDQPRLLGNP